MNREEKILQHIDKNGIGIEIGASHNPVAPKKQGYNVHVIDHLNREQLKAKYKEDTSVNPDMIEEVDFVWQGESYARLTGKSKFYDWIIASHVIEHVPDLIGFLQDCDAILKDQGVISLVVPDKRYCFDHYRPVSGLSKIIDHHIGKNKIPSPGTVVEGYLNAVSKAEIIAWDANTKGEHTLLFSLADALTGMESVVKDQAYIDVHTWCFVPHSFRLMIHDLFCLGLIPFQEVSYLPTCGCEFYITLGRKGNGIDIPRLELLKTIALELHEPAPAFEDLHQTAQAPPPPPDTPIPPASFLKRWLGGWGAPR